MKLTIRAWRQRTAADCGRLVDYQLDGVEPDMSFLEMMDMLNEQLIMSGEDPVAFDHDCREGICGMCSMAIDGVPHGPEKATTTCQLYMRHFSDGDTITVEPWRAAAFPVVKDLVVDRSAFDRIIQAGGYVSAPTGSAMLFTAAKVTHLSLMPQGQPERYQRVTAMVEQMDAEGFGGCTNTGVCTTVCPKGIPLETIARMNGDILKALRP